MILKYILKNFTRRKVRTILMVLSLMVSTGLIVAMSATVETVRRSNVDLIASAVGRYDLSVGKRDTSSQPFVDVAEITPLLLAADENITAVYPRIQSDIEINVDGEIGRGWLIALDSARDDIGFVDVIEGEYILGDGQVAVLEPTALNFDLQIGDTIDVAYSFPQPREEGKVGSTGVSERRTTQRFTIGSIIRQDGIVGVDVREGLIVDLADVQAWLNLPGQSQTLVATVDPGLYETSNAETAALRVRDVARNVLSQLGEEYTYSLDKAAVLDRAAQGFLALQALINIYGLTSLGIVGLLIHTLVMTNVQEQRRDMAVLRILGSQRNLLFAIVVTEVLTIGAIGITLGVGLGQLITRFIIVPLIKTQMLEQGINSPLTPKVTLTAVLPAVIASFIVLIISSLKPAQQAAKTKVMHAINPGVADNIQIEDLAQLRERSPNARLFFSGVALMLIFTLIIGFQTVESFGGPALQVSFFLLSLGLLILGLGLIFFITTVPFERFVLFGMGLLFPRITYFARRNVGRGKLRNTLISMLVLFSGVLPSSLATQLALENANFETTVRLDMGAPVRIRSSVPRRSREDPEQYRLKPSFLTDELAAVSGIDQIVGLTPGYRSRVSDPVQLRSASVQVIGVNGRLNDILFQDMLEFSIGDASAFDRLDEPGAVIISEGLADYLSLSVGETVKLTGEGVDHVVDGRIIAIARRIPGFSEVTRSRTKAEQSSSDILVSLAAYQELTTELNLPLPQQDARSLETVLATLAPDAVAEDIAEEMGKRFGQSHNFWLRFFDIQLENNRRQQAAQQVFLLVMTVISFTTAVFGVFAVIYVTIYARRLEVGMMKAIGMRRRELTGMLIVESITMTLGAALAGIAAGATMGYISFWSDRALQERPVIFAVDTTVMPFIVIMVVLASILGAAFSARRIVKKRAVEILRM